MNADFLDAHDRHWKDAEFLLEDSRLANADHLYGLASECGLKRLMVAFGMLLDSDGKPKKQDDKVHANKVWDRYETYRAGRPEASAYELPIPNPFDDWDVAQRYAPRSTFCASRVAKHQKGCECINVLIKKAIKDGWL